MCVRVDNEKKNLKKNKRLHTSEQFKARGHEACRWCWSLFSLTFGKIALKSAKIYAFAVQRAQIYEQDDDDDDNTQ